MQMECVQFDGLDLRLKPTELDVSQEDPGCHELRAVDMPWMVSLVNIIPASISFCIFCSIFSFDFQY